MVRARVRDSSSFGPRSRALAFARSRVAAMWSTGGCAWAAAVLVSRVAVTTESRGGSALSSTLASVTSWSPRVPRVVQALTSELAVCTTWGRLSRRASFAAGSSSPAASAVSVVWSRICACSTPAWKLAALSA
jgi:hypothetical protein